MQYNSRMSPSFAAVSQKLLFTISPLYDASKDTTLSTTLLCSIVISEIMQFSELKHLRDGRILLNIEKVETSYFAQSLIVISTASFSFPLSVASIFVFQSSLYKNVVKQDFCAGISTRV